jgi:hypothetical protein
MTYYVGLGVSVKTTSVWIVDEPGKIVKERSMATEPDLSPPGLARPARGRTDIVVLHDGLATRGLPVVCVEAPHMPTALATMRNKTDRNDARGEGSDAVVGRRCGTTTFTAIRLWRSTRRHGRIESVFLRARSID